MVLENLVVFASIPLRVMLGIVFVYHGYPKMLTAKGFKQHVNVAKSIGFVFPTPVFWGFCSAFAEFFGGLMVFSGTFTRIGALLIALNMLVAWWASKFKWGKKFSIVQNGYEYDLVLIAGALTLVLLGGGAYSLDGFLGLPLA